MLYVFLAASILAVMVLIADRARARRSQTPRFSHWICQSCGGANGGDAALCAQCGENITHAEPHEYGVYPHPAWFRTNDASAPAPLRR